ncbi:MAG: sodium:proton antiporter, partial [Firmicutes bacterium]|nr:sodium:proton antiporter [Bacillota bacterium]
MDLLIAFGIFIIFMVLSLIAGISTIPALFLGLVVFLAVGRRKGFSLKSMLDMSVGGIKNSLVVIEVMLIIGLITAVWRVSGTITVFVYYGMKIIVPPLFLLITFLLSCVLSYALGTSFGTAGTVGVIFMTLARSGGVDPVMTAGVIMSGIYFGDRCSPVSSSANLVAGVTGTKIFDNVKLMMKTAMVPLIL